MLIYVCLIITAIHSVSKEGLWKATSVLAQVQLWDRERSYYRTVSFTLHPLGTGSYSLPSPLCRQVLQVVGKGLQ